MNVITYIGNGPARDVIRKYEFGAPKKLKMNVLLTTYELTLRDAKELGDIKWQALAVDEVSHRTIVLARLNADYVRRPIDLRTLNPSFTRHYHLSHPPLSC